MDDIKQRLKEAADSCVSTYEAWRAKTGDHALREALQEAVHELRKVGARLEIELAVSDRKQQNNEPIPIPSHRASRRGGPGGDVEGGEEDFNSNAPRSNNRPQGGGRPDRQPVQIRQRSENEGNGPAAAKDPAAPAGEGEDAGRKRPLSLRRTSDSE